ncbi:MAG TPA: PIN domain-containing protein [Anaerolineales bacterium]|nr:PIN domain-containing protein [Anaerolineales bacterium]
MPTRPAVFLDTSALFAGIWSATGGARMILKLCEAGVIRLVASPHVLQELEGALRRKAPETLGLFALLLDRSRLEVTAPSSEESLKKALALTGHAGDARVLAAALDIGVDFLVTLDQKHMLEATALRSAMPFLVGTPGDFLGWVRGKLVEG